MTERHAPLHTLAAVVLCALAALPSRAGTTGGYRGPDGNGVYPATGLLREWPQEGPKLLWKANVGDGYAGPTVVDGTVYLSGGAQGVLHVYTMDGRLKDRFAIGSCIWKRWSGPRSTPLVQDGVAVCTTPSANITAIDLTTGEPRWQVNAWKSYGKGLGSMGWGYPETPVLAGGKLIVNTCSRYAESPPFVAIDMRTGKTIWEVDQGGEKKNYACGDGSSAVIRHRGKDYFVGVSWRYISFIDAETGKLIWEIPTSLPGGTEKNLKPLYCDGSLLVDLGARLLMVKLSDDGTSYTRLWSSAYSGNFQQGVVLDGRIYLVNRTGAAVKDERPTAADVAPAPLPPAVNATASGSNVVSLVCLDPSTGSVLSSVPRSGGEGHVIAADGMIYMVDDAGNAGFRLRLIEPDGNGGMRVVSDYAHALKPEDTAGQKTGDELRYSSSSCPVIADGRLILRYGSFFVFDLRAEGAVDGTRRDGMGHAANAHPPIRWWREENVKWTASLPGGGRSSPVTDGDRVWVTCEPNTVACLEATTGKELWRRAVDGAKGITTPVVREGRVFAAFGNGTVCGFDREGKRLWSGTVEPAAGGPAVSAPVLSGPRVIVQGRRLQAWDDGTGEPAWSCAPPAGVTAAAAPTPFRLNHTNALITSWGALLRTADGVQLLQCEPALAGSPAVVAGGTVFRSVGGRLTAHRLPAASGGDVGPTPLWSRSVSDAGQDALLVCVGDVVYRLAGGIIAAHDGATGQDLGSGRVVAGNAPAAGPAGLVVAGGMLYATVGGQTAVFPADRALADPWRYLVPDGAPESAYAGDRQWLRGGNRLHCVGGLTPTEPVAPEVKDVKALRAQAGAPLQAFTNDTTPDAWVAAGPFAGRNLETDYLASLGGRTNAAPKAGDTASLKTEEARFRALADADFWTDPRFTNGRKSVDLTGVLQRKAGVCGILSTVIDNEAPRYVRVQMLTPDGLAWNYRQRLEWLAWLAGQPVDVRTTYRLQEGHYPLLIQAGIGEVEQWGRIWMAPRLVDVTAEVEKRQAEYARRAAGWPAYQAALQQPFAFAP